jgi:hypothetical protein
MVTSDQQIIGGILLSMLLLWTYTPATDQVYAIAFNSSLPANATSRVIGDLLYTIYPPFHLILLLACVGYTIAIAINEMNK